MALRWRTEVVVLTVLLFFAHWELGQTKKELLILNDPCEEGMETLNNVPRKHGCTDTCVASGDPHINTFDCVKFEYHGVCSYTLVKNCDDGLENFEIIGEFHRLAYHHRLSVIKKMLITCQGMNIELDGAFGVTIDGTKMTTDTFVLPCATINRYCNAVVVTMSNGITIYWSRPFRAVIEIAPEVTETLSGILCGLCGNNNGIRYDDLATPDKSLVSNAVDFGDSWRTDMDCNLCHDCENAICQNNHDNLKEAEFLCGIFNNETIPCGVYDEEKLFEECVNNLCATLPEIDKVCHLINSYIETCVANEIEIRLHLNGLCKDGCHSNQIFIPYGGSWTRPDCSEECKCQNNTGITCEKIQCHAFATCVPDSEGSASCVCNVPQYSGDGRFSCIAFWSDWCAWGACSVTCDNGMKYRSRACSVDDACTGPSDDASTCTLPACPSWSDWSAWGACSVTCDNGMKYRNRTCSVDGACTGLPDDASTCILAACPSWSDWSAWGACSATCDNGMKYRSRTCSVDDECTGPSDDASTCILPACPSWSDWGAWGACSATCDNGMKYRSRTCSINGACTGPSDDASTCNLQACPSWSSWGAWSPCSKSCGGGTRNRYRTCTGVGSCPGSSSSSGSCNTNYCPYWGSWGPWGSCSVECGGGYRRRYRTCYGGSCIGSTSQDSSCNTDECAGCFASNSMVRIKTVDNGEDVITSKRLADLKIGESVESYDPDTKSVTFSEVYFITHQHDNYNSSLIKLVFGFEGEKELSLSLHPKHLVYACINKSPCDQPPSDPVTAESVSIGDALWIRNSNDQFIRMAVQEFDYFHYNVRHPMTFNHFIVVDGALASVHMHDENLYRKLTAPLRFVYNVQPSLVDTGLVNQLVSMWDMVEQSFLFKGSPDIGGITSLKNVYGMLVIQ
ncbi:uncharacterized protein [Amphiura filiformis]|uniref:uncharacterized protein n=1 Tax=Amphiura filiformis TaxID=82378 RepID=UPI003B21940A